MNSIIIKDVSKEYKNKVVALHNINLNIESGVFGLLGHNGAGKTTLMKGICTLIKPTSGIIEVCGFNTQSHANEVKKHIGYLPQELAMYPNLSVLDFVSYIASLKEFKNRKEVFHVLEQVDMLQFARRKISTLSGGMKRRVGIAQALIGNPDILIVDEPTAGLDPEERVRFRGILSNYAREDKIVILSTHIVEDVYQVCENLAVLRNGKLFFSGTTTQLIENTKNKVKLIQIQSENELVELQKTAIILSTNYEKNCITVKMVDDDNIYSNIAAIEPSLEDAYIYCMGGKSHE